MFFIMKHFPGLSHASNSGKPFMGTEIPEEKEKIQIYKEVRL